MKLYALYFTFLNKNICENYICCIINVYSDREIKIKLQCKIKVLNCNTKSYFSVITHK